MLLPIGRETHAVLTAWFVRSMSLARNASMCRTEEVAGIILRAVLDRCLRAPANEASTAVRRKHSGGLSKNELPPKRVSKIDGIAVRHLFVTNDVV
jgi:hypothetical protein